MEKRKHPRLRKLLFAAAKKYDDNGELEEGSIGMTMDISEGGMLIMTESPLPFMARLDLFLGFGDTILKVKGEVTRLEKQAGNKTLMGLKFLEVDDEALSLLKVASFSGAAEGHRTNSHGDTEKDHGAEEGK
ncbi:MAG: PilZ domain-containing protein [Nitrospinota bacterium]|nr:PilZ domain-containing protein [Nitrospinota bacterium]MDH5677445.1 PilZ domain-containing protein [Nitrospinota bacterium]MDH5756830.1 PilZ domain-containing protein [Nitrospinota bacterium]